MPNAGDILAAYGRVLETKTDLLLTESQLPASREDIKAILVAEALKAQRAGSADYLNTIRTCHSLLSTFVPDEVVQAISNERVGLFRCPAHVCQ